MTIAYLAELHSVEMRAKYWDDKNELYVFLEWVKE